MRAAFANKYLIVFSRVILGVVFIIASIEKISSPGAFAASIQAYQILPVAVINAVALVTAWMELLCGIFLLSGVLVRASALLISVMLIVFITAMLTAMARGLTIDCGCFGKGHETPLGWLRIIEDVGLLFLGIHLISFPYPKFSVENLFVSVRHD
jgi:putative oxidoreductase